MPKSAIKSSPAIVPFSTADSVMRRKEVLAFAQVSNTSLHNWMKEGLFPKSFPIGKNCVGWSRISVENWLAERIKAAAP